MGNLLCKHKKNKVDMNEEPIISHIFPINEESLSEVRENSNKKLENIHTSNQPSKEDEQHKNNKQEHKQEELSPEDIVIENLVKRYLQDEHINSKLIPDFIEKKLYRNVLKIITGILKDTIENAEVTVLDHRIKFIIEPIIEPVTQTIQHTKDIVLNLPDQEVQNEITEVVGEIQ